MSADVVTPQPGPVSRAVDAFRCWLAAQQATNDAYRRLQTATQDLDPGDADLYAAIVQPIAAQYRNGGQPASRPAGDEDRDWDVSWETTVTAPTPQLAARDGANLLCQVDPHAQVFDVRPVDAGSTGEDWTRVDLSRRGR